MKIAFFTDTYYPHLNGVTISVDNFAKELRKKGHTVYIFAPKNKRYKNKDEYTITLPSITLVTAQPNILMPVPTSYKSYKQVFSLSFDIVHAHGNGPFSLFGYQVAKMKRIPYILTFHTFHEKYTHYIFNGKLITPNMAKTYLRVYANLCDAVITPSEKMKAVLTSYGVKKEITVVPNFVNQQNFDKRNPRYLHRRFSIPSRSPILVTVGRLGKEKNFSFLISMFQDLAKMNENCHLVIVGEGSEKKYLQSLREEFGLMGRVHFTGRIPAKNMPSIYADSSLFVFASETEVHPLVTMEAAAAGLPLVVAKDKAFDHAVVDGFNGYQLELQNELFAKTINSLLTDKELHKKFSENSKIVIAKNFSPDKITDSLIGLYEKTLIEQKKKTRTLPKLNKTALLKLRQTAQAFVKIFNTD